MRAPLLWVVLTAGLLVHGAGAAEPTFPPPGTGPLPDGLGTNIHFTSEKPGEMKMLAEGGFRWLRMDLGWGGVEHKKGVYDWAPFDRLLKSAEPYGTRFLLILDYSNTLYESDRSVRTAEGRSAMARWAAAAVRRYKGRGILWEMWNEPNISVFWKPDPNAADYIKLTKAVGEAIRKAAPDEMYIGPATSTIDFPFLEACFRGGLLEYWSAVSVHPYRQKPPETVGAEYARLRRLIARYAPKGKTIPILSAEWGYSSVWGGMNVEKQGKYLPRQWLINLANDVPLSIWYDWHDDGRDATEAEHHFGTVLNPVHAGRDPVYDPKPAYHAAKTLTTVLKGFRFNKRLAVGGADDYVMLFARGEKVALAAWSTSARPGRLVIPASPGGFRVVGHLGKALPALKADKAGLALTATDAPVYLLPAKPNDLLAVAAAWQRAPHELRRPGPGKAGLKTALSNPLDRKITVRFGSSRVELGPGQKRQLDWPLAISRDAGAKPTRLALRVEGLGDVAQATSVAATNPLIPTPHAPAGGKLPLSVTNEAREPFAGWLILQGRGQDLSKARLVLRKGQAEALILLPEAPDEALKDGFRLRIVDDAGRCHGRTGEMKLSAVDDFARYTPETLAKAYQVLPDGDAKVASTQSLALGAPKAGPPLPGLKCLRLTYDMARGWKFVRLAPRKDETKRIEGKPASLAMWLHGDGSGHSPRLRFRDATGQTFQPAGEPIRWTGWRYVRFPMDATGAGHWGGAGDGKVHYPISWDTLLLIDKDRNRPGGGEVFLASPTLLY